MRTLDFLRVFGLVAACCLFIWDPHSLLWVSVGLWAVLCHLMYRESSGRGMK